jgi:hypothetical protein
VKRVRDNTLFCGFNPAVSVSALKAMRATIRELFLQKLARAHAHLFVHWRLGMTGTFA